MTRVQLRCATLTIIALTAACSDDPVSQNVRASVATSTGASLSSNRGNGNEGNGVGNDVGNDVLMASILKSSCTMIATLAASPDRPSATRVVSSSLR